MWRGGRGEEAHWAPEVVIIFSILRPRNVDELELKLVQPVIQRDS